MVARHYHLFKENKAWVLVPVPQSKQRTKERGFNPTEVVAHFLSKKINQPVINYKAVTKRETKKQALLKKDQRRKNIRGAFTLHDDNQVRRNNIIIIDDLVTTGATTTELARIIYQGNPHCIVFLSIAH
jgi:ComF family protein